MDKKVDDILFACMAYMTHYDKERQELYLNDSDLTDVRKYVKTLVSLTSRQITAHIKILVEKNLVLRDEERNRYVIRNFIHGQYYIVPLIFFGILSIPQANTSFKFMYILRINIFTKRKMIDYMNLL